MNQQMPSSVEPPVRTCWNWTNLAVLGRDIKLSHSVFALPFALLATFLAAGSSVPEGRLPSVAQLTLIVLCMVLARTTAMSFNRVVDAGLDAGNPRTRGRAIPSGRLSRSFVVAVIAVCSAGFVAATSGFWFVEGNLWPLVLSPVALAWLCGYSFSKRFTWLCHLWLGSALALSPVAAVVAIRPAYLARPEPYLLAALVVAWVAGFDIIYALQDVEVDRSHRLYSMPARLGVEPALWIGRLLHAGVIAAMFALTGVSPQLGGLFLAGAIVATGLLVLEHALVWGSKTHHINMAFFTVNGVISLLLGGLGIAGVVRRILAR